MSSNSNSKFSPFVLHLKNDLTLTGIKYIPTSPPLALHRPLVVMIHGGTCSAHNFDIAPGPLTASTTAELLSIPAISINRPGYLGSTPLPISEGSTFHKTLGEFNHKQLFPAIWREFGEPNNCSALVPLAHSLGAPGIIVSSGLHAQDPAPDYPLAGIIFSGWGSRFAATAPQPPDDPSRKLDWKRLIMLGDRSSGRAPPEAEAALEAQDQPENPAERAEILDGSWHRTWRDYSDQIIVPVMWGQGEHDMFFEGSMAHVREYGGMFAKCPRFDGSLVLGAPHAIEWSYAAQGWYARCFGFAMEVAAWLDKN